MKLIMLINNKKIEEKLKNLYYSEYELFILRSNNVILGCIEENENAIIIIRKEACEDSEFEEIIFKIKEKSSNVQIIVLLKELTKPLKEMLFSKEVFSIIAGRQFSLKDLIDLIESPKRVVYKESSINKNNVFFITGSKGVGKTSTALTLGKIVARNTDKKVLIIDLDFLCPTLDVYLNVSNNYSLTEYMKDLSNNNLKSIECYESRDKVYKNLKYILNFKSTSVPSSEKIAIMIKQLLKYYDYIFVDTNSLMINTIYSLCDMNSYEIIHVVEPGKRAFKNFKIDTSFIGRKDIEQSTIICNKLRRFESLTQIENNYKLSILGSIKYSYLFNKKEEINKIKYRYSLNKVLDYIGITKYKNIKLKIINKLLRRKLK